MEALYAQLTDYMQEAGQQLVVLQADAKDIGVTKVNVTEQDIKIERALTDMVLSSFPDHKVFAEEEHDTFESAENIWVFDPISATRAYLEGRQHYASVVSHVRNGVTQFAAVYDPSSDELFTAQLGKGALLNGKPIQVSSTAETLLNNTATSLFDSAEAVKLRAATADLNPLRNEVSFAVNYCWVADGRFDGVVSIAKDSFPEFAGALILGEAGGKLTHVDGGAIQPNDRLFIGGNPAMHAELMKRSAAALAA
jgi:myo-inositol-1(or 4)-monophosphatase